MLATLNGHWQPLVLSRTREPKMSGLSTFCEAATSRDGCHTGYALGRHLVHNIHQSRLGECSADVLDNYSLCAFYSGHTAEAAAVMTHLLDHRPLDPGFRLRVSNNYRFCIQPLLTAASLSAATAVQLRAPGSGSDPAPSQQD